MTKVISFCLWGDNPKYTVGAIRNAERAKMFYSGWDVWMYFADCVPKDIVQALSDLDCHMIPMGEGSWKAMFWRFLPAANPNITVISRDTDSRLGIREKYAVDDWLASDKDFHIMRDHPYHRAPILGGMWGSKADFLRKIGLKSKIIEWNKIKQSYQLGVDQDFLGRIIYPIVKDNSFEHSDFNIYYGNKTHKFKERENYEFIGDVFDENDERHPDYWKIIKNVK